METVSILFSVSQFVYILESQSCNCNWVSPNGILLKQLMCNCCFSFKSMRMTKVSFLISGRFDAFLISSPFFDICHGSIKSYILIIYFIPSILNELWVNSLSYWVCQNPDSLKTCVSVKSFQSIVLFWWWTNKTS